MCKKLIPFVLVLGLVLASMADAADPDLVAHWRFDDGSGTTAFDASGNGHDGTIMGDPKWVPGKLGGALEFDGDGDYVDCGSSTDFEITVNISITCWIKVNLFDKNWQAIMTTSDSSWRVHRSSSSNNIAWGTSGLSPTDLTGTTDVSTGEWFHIAAVYNGTQKLLYIDGNLDASSDSTGNISTSSMPVYIGENSGATNRFWDGLIDDVRIYRRALSETEILGVMAGGGTDFPQASSPVPENGTFHPETWVNLAWRAGDFAVSHDVYFGDNFDDVSAGAETSFQGNQADTFLVAGFPGFAFPDGLVPGTTYYWRIDEVNDTEPNSPWIGDVWSFTIPPKTAYLPDPADSAAGVDVDGTLTWTAGFGAKLHTVYFGDNFEEVDNATGGQIQGTTTFSPGTLKMAKTYYWRVDEFDVIETHKGNVWSFTTEGAVTAINPANGAVDITQTPVLTWAPGLGATHEVFFGADPTALESKGTGNLGSESFESEQLLWDTTYYWRIDEANNANADSPWTGPLWSFTTANFLIIDDMEAYNDLDPADPASNRIFNAWIDGFGDSTNGSLVGYENPPFAEQSNVHGGNQSMPMSYDNSAGKSEATLTLTSNRDWTVNGVDTLVIWYVGGSANAAETMYVALNDSAVVTNDNPDAALINVWTQWTISLQAFADLGVNLSNVSSITLGLSSVSGGTGTIFYDDIQLHPPAP